MVEKSGLILADPEVWRGHYERTLQEWLKRFDRNLDRVKQLQDSKARGTVPMTRDYLYSARNT